METDGRRNVEEMVRRSLEQVPVLEAFAHNGLHESQTVAEREDEMDHLPNLRLWKQRRRGFKLLNKHVADNKS